MASTAAVLNILLVANATQANAQLAKTQANLTATQRKAEVTGAAMKKAMLGVGIAAAGAAVALYKIGEEFDDAYDKIRTGTGATGKELERLERSFRDVVRDVPATFGQASDAIAGLNSRLGLSGKPLAKTAKQITELSRITGTDVKSNVDGISKAFNDWDVSTKRMGRTLDGFYRLSQDSGVSVSDLTTAVQQFGSPLRQLGYSLGEAASMWATFVRAGVNTQTMVPGLKLAIASLTAPTDDLRLKMEQLGIAVGKPDVALRQILDLLGSGSTLSQIEKTTLAMEVFGKRAGADMAEAIKQGRFEIDDMLATFRTGSDTIRKSGRETMDLSEQWQQFTNLLKLKVEPIAAEVFGGLGKLMKEATRAFKRDGFQGLLDLLTEKLNDALPKLAEAGAKIGVAIMKGIAGAFWDSNILGKLFMAGTFIRLVGGAGVFGKIGASMGTRMLGGMSTTIAGGKGVKAAAMRFGMAFGGWAGPLAAAGIVAVIAGIEIGKSGVVQDNTTDITKYTDFLMERYDLTQKRAERVVNYMKKHPGLGAEESMRVMNYRRTFSDLLGGFDRVGDKSKNARDGIVRDQDAVGRSLDRSKDNTRRFSVGAGNNFERVRAIVAEAMRQIGANTNSVLGNLGAKKLQFAIEQNKTASGGGFHGFQQGGIVPGTGSGDKVPLHVAGRLAAMVEPGEYVSVANRNATAALMAANGAVPRYATGGVIQQALGPVDMPPIVYDPSHAGSQRHLHLDFFTKQQALAYGHKMQGMGWTIAEYTGSNPYGFGPVTTQHQAPGHYDGTAFDANTGADETIDEIRAVVRMLGGAAVGGAAAQKIKNLILKGPDGPLKDMGQAAIDKATKAANAYIAKHTPTVEGGVNYVSGGDNAVAVQIGNILTRQGFDRAAAAGIIGNAYRESLWNPASVGSGGGGLWGFTTSPVSLADLQAFASNQGRPWTDVGLQTQFMLSHGGMDLQGVLNALTSPEQTAAMFMTAWERPGVPALEERQAAARRAYEMKGWQKGGIVAKLAKGGLLPPSVMKAASGGPSTIPGAYPLPGGGPNDYVTGGPPVANLAESIWTLLGSTARDKAAGQSTQYDRGVKRIKDNIDALGLKPGMLDSLKSKSGDIARFAENADAASSLGLPVGGKSQIEWLQEQLEAQFEYRWMLVKVETAARGRAKEVAKFVRKLEHEIERMKKVVDRNEDREKEFKEAVSKAKGKEAKEAAEGRLKTFQAMLGGQRAKLGLLNGMILPGANRELTSLRNHLDVENSEGAAGILQSLQGIGVTKKKLRFTEPFGAELGLLKGDILSTQLSLRDALAESTDDGGRHEALDEIARQLTAATARENALLRAQMPVFQSMVPYMGAFASGGVALVGETGPELASLPSGTRITSASETRSMVAPEVSLILNDCTIDTHGQTLEEAVQVEVNGQLQEAVRIANRRAPSTV